jgi:hypothetical protein
VTRGLALVLLTASVVAYAGVTRPLQRRLAAAADEFKAARDERRDLRRRIQRVERRGVVPRLAAARAKDVAPGELVREVRRSLVKTVEEAGLSPVRLSVRPGPPAAGAAVQLDAQGTFTDVVRFTGLVTRAERGIALQKIRLGPRSGTTGLDLEAVAFGGTP